MRFFVSIELRGIEVTRTVGDVVVSAIVRTEYPDIYEKNELFRNEVVNRGRILTALSEVYGIHPGQIVWPRHIKVKDL